MNYYRTLGVPFSASRKEIKTAFRTLAKSCHPDLHPNDPESAKRFVKLNQAYEVLSDPDARKRYHQQLLERMRKKPDPKRPHAPRPFTEQEKAAFMAALAEEKRIVQLRKKMMSILLPIFTVLIFLGFLNWAWNHGVLNWQYAIIMLVASAFLALPPTALAWIASFEFLRRRARR